MAAQHSYIRKVSEDAKLRPFLSAHFDVEAYLRSVVEKNRSEECFKDITACIGKFLLNPLPASIRPFPLFVNH